MKVRLTIDIDVDAERYCLEMQRPVSSTYMQSELADSIKSTLRSRFDVAGLVITSEEV